MSLCCCEFDIACLLYNLASFYNLMRMFVEIILLVAFIFCVIPRLLSVVNTSFVNNKIYISYYYIFQIIYYLIFERYNFFIGLFLHQCYYILEL